MAEPTINQAFAQYNGASSNAAIAIELDPATTKGVLLFAFNYSSESGGAKYLDGIVDAAWSGTQWRPAGDGTNNTAGTLLKGHRNGNYALYVHYWKGSDLTASSGSGEIRWWWGDINETDRSPQRQTCGVIEITGDFNEDDFASWVENTDFESNIIDNIQNPSNDIGSASGNRVLDWICGAVTLSTAWTKDAGQTLEDSVFQSGTNGIITSESGAATSTLSYTGSDTSYGGFHFLVDLHPASGVDTVDPADADHAHAADNVTLFEEMAPSGFTAVPQADNAVRCSWTDESGGAYGHRIYRKTTGNYTALADTDPGVTTFDDETAEVDTLYTYRVCVLALEEQCSSEVTVQMVTVADASHAHAADATTIGAELDPADADHAHTAAQCEVLAQEVLAPFDCVHAHTADAPTLGVTLDPADTLHAHTAEDVQLGDLFPDSCVHAHIADGLTFGDWEDQDESGSWTPQTETGTWTKQYETGDWS